jgi:hypothetical protein
VKRLTGPLNRALAAFAAHVGKQPTDQLAGFQLKQLL